MNQLLPAPSPIKLKYKLLYPQRVPGTKPEASLGWFSYPHEGGIAPAAEDALEAFVKKLESYLVCARTAFNLDQLWKDTRPEGEPESLDEATGKIYTALVCYTAIKENIDPFIHNYAERNEGRKPWIDPIIRSRFNAAQREISSQDHASALKSANTFGDWVSSKYF
jgi:hypothetical protein